MAGMENHGVMMRELMKFQHGKREFMKETDLMRACIFSAMMNIAAAIILFGKGAPEMNHLETGIPARPLYHCGNPCYHSDQERKGRQITVHLSGQIIAFTRFLFRRLKTTE